MTVTTQADPFTAGRRYIAGLSSIQEQQLREVVAGLKAGGDVFKDTTDVNATPLGELVVPPDADVGLKITDITTGPATYAPESLPNGGKYFRELKDGEVAAKIAIHYHAGLGQVCATYVFERQASGGLLPADRIEHYNRCIPC